MQRYLFILPRKHVAKEKCCWYREDVCGVWVVLPLGSKPALTFYSLVREGC